MTKVSLQNVKKEYSGNVAVKDFTLDIEDKEFVVLVGPSGCGKTTTLRMIAGLEEISDGKLYIDNTLVNNVDPKDRDIAMVFQNYALYPHKTVYENMAFSLTLRNAPKAEVDEKVRNVARILEIEHLLDRKPQALSGGQRQRVALGRAIVRKPKVFLMDEPLSNLDAKLRVQMRAEISRLHQKLQATIIYVTHDQTEAMTMGTRIVIMKDGDIQQIDTPSNAYDHPVNLFVAGFIGSPQMNILTATVIENDGSLFLKLPNNNLLSVTPEKESILKACGYIHKEVYVGIRPEDLREMPTGAPTECSVISGTVEVVEHLGSETYFYLSVCPKQIIARVHARSDKKFGDEAILYVHPGRIHLFDYTTEKAL